MKPPEPLESLKPLEPLKPLKPVSSKFAHQFYFRHEQFPFKKF